MSKKKIDAKLQQIKNEELENSPNITALIQSIVNNVSIEVNPSELSSLAKTDIKLAEEYIGIIKSNQAHIQKMDVEILTLEKIEQAARLTDAQKNRTYMDRGQWLGLVIMLSSLSVLAFAIYMGETGFAITSVIGVILLSLYHISGKREQTSIKVNSNDIKS